MKSDLEKSCSPTASQETEVKIEMSEEDRAPKQKEAERIFAAKKEWHKKQSQLPLKEKVRILLKMQKDDYPILLKRGVLKSWEKPWDIDP